MKENEENDEKTEHILKKEKEEDKGLPISPEENKNLLPVLETKIKDEKDIKKRPKPTEKEKEKIDPIYEAKKKLTLRDGILTLIGNEFHRIGFGCIMVIFNLTTYLMSYLRHYQEKKTITLQYTYFIGPVMSITMGLFTPMVGALENKIGLKLAIILGGLLSLWSSVILYLSKNYYIDLFAFFVNSLGSSIGALMSRNIMGYFFHIRGKLSGVLSVIGSLVSSAYNVVGEKWIVNPKSEEATVDKSYYTIEVCQNLLKFFRICWICLSLGTILTVIFVVPFDKKKHVRLFVPKFPKGFEKGKKKKFDKKKEIKKEDIINDDKIRPLIPEDEKNEENKNKIERKGESKEEKKENDSDNKIIKVNDDKEEENINIDKEKEIKESKSKKDHKNKNKIKNDFSKTTSVPAFLVTNKDKLLFNSGIIENSEDTDNKDKDKDKDKNKSIKTYKKRRSQSMSYRDSFSQKFPLINVIPEMEVVAVAPADKSIRKKFNIQFIKQALKSRRVLFLFLMGLFSAPLGNFLMSTWRPIGIRKGIPTLYLQNIGTYRPFITCAATLLFSTLSDYVPFRYLYALFSILSTIIGITFCFTFRSPGFFTFIILLNNVVFAGKMSITSPHYMKVFGLKYYIEIGGVIGLSRVFMSPLCTVFIFLFETYIAAPEGKEEVSDTPYFILFITTGLLNVIAAILSMFETEEEFKP